MKQLQVATLGVVVGLLAQTEGVAQSAQDARSQSSGPASSETAGNGPEANLSEIVVTAQKRTERLVDVPISVTAVNDRQLEQSGITDVSSLAQVVPGFHMNFSGPEAEPTIRGVTTTSSGVGITPNIATYVDGFLRYAEVAQAFDLNDVTSVQVLKGPQGTLFGRNATGGAILVTTADPVFNPTATLKASYGRFNDARVNFTGSTGLTDTLAGSVSLYGRRMDGYDRDVATGRSLGASHSYAGKAKLLWQPSDSTKFVLTFEHTYVDDPSPVLLNAYNGISSGVAVPGALISSVPYRIASDINNSQTATYNSLFLKCIFDLGFSTLTSYTGYQTVNTRFILDLDASSAPILSVDDPEVDRVITQEFDLNSRPGGPLDWVVGAFYMNAYANQDEAVPVGNALIDATSQNQTFAIFADGTYKIVPRLALTLGARYGADQVGGHYSAHFAPINGDAQHTFNSFTPRVVLKYELTPDSNVYASFSRGYKAGVFNLNSLSSTQVQPEKITAYEVGYKVAQGPLQAETAAFYYKYKDLQVSSFIPPQIEVLLNAAKATIYGFDGHIAYEVSSNLKLGIGGSYVHGTYDSFPLAPYAQFDFTTGALTQTPRDATGAPITQTPRFSGNADVDYHMPLWGGTGQVTANYSYTTKQHFDVFGQAEQNAYGLLNVRGAWTTNDNAWTLALYGRNVTNKNYRVQVILDAGFLQQWGPPATYGLEVTRRF
jgi:iron complex outermembrane receptor protein